MITINPLSGSILSTNFSISGSPFSDFTISWGDGTINSNVSSHTYSSYGEYSVSVNFCSSVSSFSISADDYPFLKDSIKITADDSCNISCPLTITFNLSSTSEYRTVYFYSSGSASYKYETDRNFWSHLNPEWEFIFDDKVVDSLDIQCYPVYSGTAVIGYSSCSSINYIDDLPGNVKLILTLDNNFGINSNIIDTKIVSLCSVIPDKLIITSDGINPIERNQWADLNIPYIVSVGSSELSCTNILHNVSGYLTDVKFYSECYGVDSSNYQTPLCSMELTDGCFKTGGYVLNTFKLPSSSLPDLITENNSETCNFNYDKLEFSKIRKSPKNVSISAVGNFICNGIEYTLTGVSNSFDVHYFENKHDFYRKGEEISAYDLMKESLPFDVTQYSNLNSYLSAIAGEGDSLGKVLDKIKNFNSDNTDINTCNIESLKDLAFQFDEDISYLDLPLPEELRRIFNFSTIPLNNLIGSRCVCNTNFTNCSNCSNSNVCSLCKFDKRSNLGDRITNSDYISSKETILYKENGSLTFNFFVVPEQNEQIYKLKELSASPFYENGLDNYCFYRWDKTPQNNPVDSIINYKDYRNRLLPSLSSSDDWYGAGGVLEDVFGFLLTKNIINS